MIFGADNTDSNSIKPTLLDIEKINSLQLGEEFTGELGNWKILKYRRDYVLILFNHPNKKDFEEFKNKEDLIKYLQEG